MRPAARLLLLALPLALLLCGGCRRGSGGKVEDLFIANKRYVVDENSDLVHVYGRLENTGQGRFREVEVVATLLSRTGDSRGENSVILQGIQPLEKRTFALEVTSHERVASVDLKVRKPKAP